jgi:hypothetical protein
MDISKLSDLVRRLSEMRQEVAELRDRAYTPDQNPTWVTLHNAELHLAGLVDMIQSVLLDTVSHS